MNSKRGALVAMLVAVEVLLLGMILRSLHVGPMSGPVFAASGLHHVDIDSKTYAPLNAGTSPDVQIDDGDNHVVVTASTDGLVHVTDARNIHGLVWGGGYGSDLSIAHVGNSVKISRQQHLGGMTGIFGDSYQRVEVQVPSASHVRITGSSGANVSGMRSDVEVESQDGRITLADIRGDVKAQSADGSVHLSDIVANSLDVRTADGRVEGTNIAVEGSAPHATLHSDDGSVRVTGHFAPGGSYQLSTNDGQVELHLAADADLTVSASSADGRIYVDGSRYGDSDSAAHTIRLGNGSGTMQLSSQDGSIHITTNGAT